MVNCGVLNYITIHRTRYYEHGITTISRVTVHTISGNCGRCVMSGTVGSDVLCCINLNAAIIIWCGICS